MSVVVTLQDQPVLCVSISRRLCTRDTNAKIERPCNTIITSLSAAWSPLLLLLLSNDFDDDGNVPAIFRFTSNNIALTLCSVYSTHNNVPYVLWLLYFTIRIFQRKILVLFQKVFEQFFFPHLILSSTYLYNVTLSLSFLSFRALLYRQ